MLGDELPREVDGAVLEVLAEREVAEHLEEREVAAVRPTSSMSVVRKHFWTVVSGAGGGSEAEEVRLQRLHPRRREETVGS